MKKLLFFLLFCWLGSLSSFAQYLYGLDPTFANNGIFVGDTGGYARIAVQTDSKIIVTGTEKINGAYYYLARRFYQDGTADINFANNGRFLPDNLGFINSHVSPICLQSDGKILLGGSGNNNLLLVRLKPSDGSLDSSFGLNGIVVTGLAGSEAISDIGMQADGKIVISGNWTGIEPNIVVARYQSNGDLDSSFGTNGIVLSDWNSWGLTYPTANDVAVMPDGRIVVGAETNINALGGTTAFTAIRLLPYGELDTSFNHEGIAYTNNNLLGLPYCKAMQLQPDGKVLLSGYADSIGIVRFDTSGKLDNSFGQSGLVKLNPSGKVVDMLLQPDGKIVLATNPDGFPYPDSCYTIYRLMPDGSIDNGFGINGQVLTKPSVSPTILWGIGLQPDGKLLASGAYLDGSTPFKLMIARYNPDAVTSIHSRYLERDFIVYPNPITDYLVIDHSHTQTIKQLHLYSTDGKLLRSQAPPNTNRLSTEGLADGIYYLHLRLADRTTRTKKIIVQKN